MAIPSVEQPEPIGDVLGTVRDYRTLVINKDNSHYVLALRYQRLHRFLGVPVIVTTAIVSTAIFASFQEQATSQWKIAAGLLSILSVVLSALQTFFGFAETSQVHRRSAEEYSRLRRLLDIFLLRYASEQGVRSLVLAELQALTEQLDSQEAESPTIPDKVYNAIKGRAR